MKSVARIGKVALHPIFVAIPIVFWLITFVADVGYCFNHQNIWYVTAFVSMLLGIFGAGLALGAGVLDYFGAEMSEAAYHTATYHMLLNLTAVALYVLNLGYRSTYTTRLETDSLHWAIAFLLELAALGTVLLSGFLGWRTAHGPGGVLTNDPPATGKRAAPAKKSGRH